MPAYGSVGSYGGPRVRSDTAGSPHVVPPPRGYPLQEEINQINAFDSVGLVLDNLATWFKATIFKKMNPLIEQAYDSPLAQAQRLRNNHTASFLARGVDNPDVVSQFVAGYTIAFQQFQNDYGWNSPSGRSMTNTAARRKQPSVKVPLTNSPIPVQMPWSVQL